MAEAETTLLVNRMTVAGATPSATRQTNIDNLILALKLGASSGINIWAKIDVLQIYAAHASSAALLNWKADMWNATQSGSPTFTANQGYTGNGTSSYLDTGFDSSTAVGRQYALNDAHMSVGVRTAGTSVNPVVGHSGTTLRMSINPRNSSGNLTARVNDATDTIFAANASRVGYYTAARTNSTTKRLYKDRLNLTAQTVTSTAVQAGNFYIFRTSTLYTDDQVSWFSAGLNLTNPEVVDLHRAIEDYTTAIATEIRTFTATENAITGDTYSTIKRTILTGTENSVTSETFSSIKRISLSGTENSVLSDTGTSIKKRLSSGTETTVTGDSVSNYKSSRFSPTESLTTGETASVFVSAQHKTSSGTETAVTDESAISYKNQLVDATENVTQSSTYASIKKVFVSGQENSITSDSATGIKTVLEYYTVVADISFNTSESASGYKKSLFTINSSSLVSLSVSIKKKGIAFGSTSLIASDLGIGEKLVILPTSFHRLGVLQTGLTHVGKLYINKVIPGTLNKGSR